MSTSAGPPDLCSELSCSEQEIACMDSLQRTECWDTVYPLCLQPWWWRERASKVPSWMYWKESSRRAMLTHRGHIWLHSASGHIMQLSCLINKTLLVEVIEKISNCPHSACTALSASSRSCQPRRCVQNASATRELPRGVMAALPVEGERCITPWLHTMHGDIHEYWDTSQWKRCRWPWGTWWGSEVVRYSPVKEMGCMVGWWGSEVLTRERNAANHGVHGEVVRHVTVRKMHLEHGVHGEGMR